MIYYRYAREYDEALSKNDSLRLDVISSNTKCMMIKRLIFQVRIQEDIAIINPHTYNKQQNYKIHEAKAESSERRTWHVHNYK